MRLFFASLSEKEVVSVAHQDAAPVGLAEDDFIGAVAQSNERVLNIAGGFVVYPAGGDDGVVAVPRRETGTVGHIVQDYGIVAVSERHDTVGNAGSQGIVAVSDVDAAVFDAGKAFARA